jgi:tetraacyldisaccharide 4'-kinase
MDKWQRRVWRSDEPAGLGGRTLSTLLTPAEWLYRVAVAARNWAYDRQVLRSTAAPIPTLAVGNLTVGGTGKTPVAAWFASCLHARGRRPAIVMRGYGGDEVEVHRLLNPSVPVHVSADRVAGVRCAQVAGADVAVLDDAFQHRAIRAHVYVVLVAAEEWEEAPRLLPRGPWREPLEALGRATMVVATRKIASGTDADRVSERLATLVPAVPRAVAHIGVSALARYQGADAGLGEPFSPRGFRCTLGLAGVARPEAVRQQLQQEGVVIQNWRAFPDHHRYSQADLVRIARDAGPGPLVATLKDAVKLGPALASELDIYVPLQRVVWESGSEHIDCLLARLSGE